MRDSGFSVTPGSTMRYESREDAIKEAESLAKAYPEEIYYVMESIGVAETPKSVYTSYDAPCEPWDNPAIGIDLSKLDLPYKQYAWPSLDNIKYVGPDRRGNKP